MKREKLSNICTIKTGKVDANHATEHGKYRFYTCANQHSYCDTYSFDGENVIVPGNGDIGLVFYYNGKMEAYQRTYVLHDIKILPKYLYYHFLHNWRNINNDKQFGSTIRYVRMSNFTNYWIEFPPLPDQEKIVLKIEELFSELDKGIAELNEAKARLKIYRQAVLKSAFEGIEKYDIIRNQSNLVTSGSRGWAKYYSDTGSKFIRITNLTREKINIDYTDMKYVQLPSNAEGIRSKLENGDVLISITADLGSIGLVCEDIGSSYINQHIAVVRFKNISQSKFFAYYLKSDLGNKELLKNKRGAGKLGLGLDDIRDSKIPIVENYLANQIVQQIESKLSVCDNIEKTIEEQLIKAENLRQSILKKAFEGRLV